MFKAIVFTGILFLGGLARGEDTFSLELKKEYSPNLLKNPGFEELDSKGNPEYWSFDNCSQSDQIKPEIVHDGVIGKNSAIVKTEGRLFGYWRQNATVKEGERYCGYVQFKLNSRGLLWIKTSQYDDKKSPLHHPKSSTEIYAKAYPEHGDNLRKVLSDFIDESYIQPVSEKDWNRFSLEFTVPAGKGINNYEVRAGSYGGEKGWVMIDDAYFGLSKYMLKIKLSGKALKNIKIKSLDGSVIFEKKLNPETETYNFNAEIPSQVDRYYIEIQDGKGNINRRDI